MARYEFPASPAQRRMWLLDQLDPGRPTYNVAWAIWLDGPLELDPLTAALTAAVDRHEALRTVFRDQAGVPVQVVDEDVAPVELAVTDLAELPEPARLDRATRLLREHASTPFDLAGEPLIRFQLLRLGADRQVLSLVAHHIVADGWSFRLLFAELAADYAALRTGQPPVTVEPEIQYPDFALWQLEHDEAGGYAEAERFWRSELAGAPTELVLPVDYPYPAREGFAAAELAADVDADTAAGLRRLAANRGITVFALVAAGYAGLLSRLTGAQDLLLAVPVSGRTRAETESVVGMFVNTLAIRADLTGNPTLAELADRLHAATARALAHQELPFARVVELSQPERQPGRSPLVQVMCAVEDSWPVLELGGLRWRPELVSTGTSKFELELTLINGANGGMHAQLSYRSDLFAPATGDLLADGLHRMLATMAGAAGTRLSEVDILAPEVRELVTRTWPAGAAGQDEPSLVSLVSAACAGDRPVITGSDGEFTGNQLRSSAERIASALAGLGVQVQDTVGILLPRGARALPALLGAWWAGAGYLPLDPSHPPARLRSMLADAGVRTLITDRAALGSLLVELGNLPAVDFAAATSTEPTGIEPASTASTGTKPTDSEPTDSEPTSTAPASTAPTGAGRPVNPPPTAAAYVLFTSGSTGRPKAVVVTHGALAQLLRAFAELVPVQPSDRVASVTTFAFDIAILDLLLPLLAGAQVIVADADQARDGNLLRRMLITSQASMLQGTPATWRLLVEAGGIPDGVRLRLSGGDVLPRELADALRHGPDVRAWNLYGPSETTVYSTGGQIAAGSGLVNIGTSIAGSEHYLLDRWQNPVAPGVTGEVYVGGYGVGRGYAGAPGLTASRFVPDPFSGRPGVRLYRSGDVGRWLPSGRIELYGRVDRQIKVRGYRVEAAEIEAALRTHPQVADAVVTAVHGTGPADVRLVGYCATAGAASGTVATDSDGSATSLDLADLAEHLRRLLPDYMVPAAFVPLTALPRTASGKVDHRALPAPTWQAAGTDSVAPRTPLERELAEIVAAVLRRSEPVGALDNFFVLGGHSLTATQLMARIWTAYGVDLPVRTLFDDPTVAGLAAAVSAAGTSSDPVQPYRTGSIA